MFAKGFHSFGKNSVTEFRNFQFSVCNCRHKSLQRHNDLEFIEVDVSIIKIMYTGVKCSVGLNGLTD